MTQEQKPSKYIAIFNERLNDYKWYNRPPAKDYEDETPLPAGCTEIVYRATGRFLTREDGERAEVLE